MPGFVRFESDQNGMNCETSAAEMSDNAGQPDPLYLFACHLEWDKRGNVAAYKELVSALRHPDSDIRLLAQVLLSRSSPRPQPREKRTQAW